MSMITMLVAVLLLVIPFTADAQPKAQVVRIGVISNGSPASAGADLDAFRERLRELGHAEGRNVTIESRFAAGQPRRLRDLAAELAGLKVDVIVAAGTLPTRVAREVTSTIPIVMVGVGDAVGAGLVKSLAKPGGNITGQSFMGAELAAKGLDVLTEAFPRALRLAVLFNPDIAPESTTFRPVAAAAQAKGVTLRPVVLRRLEDLSSGLVAVKKERPDALLVFALSIDEVKRVVEFAAKNRLPALYTFREAVDAGGLISLGPNRIELYRGAANYVDKVLKGARPGDLPVEQPTTFELVINAKTAKALGVAFPTSVLVRADRVVE